MSMTSPLAEPSRRFPLFDKAAAAGIIQSGNGLIVAPTATGKSYIGRTILEEALRKGEPGVHAYLVPYRALAGEMYESLRRELADKGIAGRVKIATGDHRDPIYPAETDVLVATFERFSALISSPDLHVARVVLDEVHLLADESRGPALESLIVRLKTWKKHHSLCALSAVVANPEKLAGWLGVLLLLGSADDRAVQVEFRCEEEADIEGRLEQEVGNVLEDGEQAVIFCSSKPASQKVARELGPLVAQYLTEEDKAALREAALRSSGDEEEVEDLVDLLSDGVTYHHAGLSRDARAAVEAAFRGHHLKVISCTPTLAAGVNLPARLVVVKDVFRTDFIRGRPRRVVLSTGELLNMLGRAGRPGKVESGSGLALVESKLMDKEEFSRLQIAIRDGTGNPVQSRLPDSFDSMMRFVLAVIADRGEATREDVVEAVKQSLWFYEEPQEIVFEKPLHDDMMEDIPSFAKVDGSIRVERAWAEPDGVAGSVISGKNMYNFSLRLSGEECSCPAKSKYYPRETCKHLACAIHTLLFDEGVEPEVRNRALYVCMHRFRRTLDLGTKIGVALRLLAEWGLIEQVPGALAATGVGAIASGSGLDLLLLRIARDRVRNCEETPTPQDVAVWVVQDFFGDEEKRGKWETAMKSWVGETPAKEMRLPEKYRGDFERNLEQLGDLATVYGLIAETVGRPEVAEVCRLARGCIIYGTAPDIVPLAALRIPKLGRARCRFLHDERGVERLIDLASADPRRISGPAAPVSLTVEWVDRARQMLASRKRIESATPEDQRYQLDEFLAAFQVDRLAVAADVPGQDPS